MKEKIKLAKIFLTDNKAIIFLSSFLSILSLFFHIEKITFFMNNVSLYNIFNVLSIVQVINVYIIGFLNNFVAILSILLLFKYRYFGNIFVIFIVLLFSIDNLVYHFNGPNLFRIGINDIMLNNLFLGIKEPQYILEFLNTYPYLIFKYFIIPFIAITITLFGYKYFFINSKKIKEHKVEFFISLSFFIYITIFIYGDKNNTPYIIKSIPHILDYVKEKIINKDRNNIYFSDYNETKFKNIIYIMDEGISIDLVNKHNALPFAKDLEKKGNLIDFNISISQDNCSYSSREKNFIGYKKEITNDEKTSPTFFQYAKNAGYKTFILDNQESFIYNGLTYKDLKWIDKYESFTKNDLITRDIILYKHINNIYKNNKGSKFLYLKKYGAHFNYTSNYPINEITKFGKISIETSNEDENIVNNYLNNVYYSTNVFLENLWQNFNDENTIFLYTSDHGQLFFDEKGERYNINHCFENDKLLRVPIYVFSKNKELLKEFEEYMINKENNSHYKLFQNLLSIMGYKKEDIIKYYSK